MHTCAVNRAYFLCSNLVVGGVSGSTLLEGRPEDATIEVQWKPFQLNRRYQGCGDHQAHQHMTQPTLLLLPAEEQVLDVSCRGGSLLELAVMPEQSFLISVRCLDTCQIMQAMSHSSCCWYEHEFPVTLRNSS